MYGRSPTLRVLFEHAVSFVADIFDFEIEIGLIRIISKDAITAK